MFKNIDRCFVIKCNNELSICSFADYDCTIKQLLALIRCYTNHKTKNCNRLLHSIIISRRVRYMKKNFSLKAFQLNKR